MNAGLASGPRFDATGGHRQVRRGEGGLSTGGFVGLASGPRIHATGRHRQFRARGGRLSTMLGLSTGAMGGQAGLSVVCRSVEPGAGGQPS